MTTTIAATSVSAIVSSPSASATADFCFTAIRYGFACAVYYTSPGPTVWAGVVAVFLALACRHFASQVGHQARIELPFSVAAPPFASVSVEHILGTLGYCLAPTHKVFLTNHFSLCDSDAERGRARVVHIGNPGPGR